MIGLGSEQHREERPLFCIHLGHEHRLPAEIDIHHQTVHFAQSINGQFVAIIDLGDHSFLQHIEHDLDQQEDFVVGEHSAILRVELHTLFVDVGESFLS